MLAKRQRAEARIPSVPTEVDVSLGAAQRSMIQAVETPARPVAGGGGATALRVVQELREPLDGIVQSLHRLSFYDASDLRPTPDSPRLLHRARALAGELRGVVDTLLGPDGDGEPGERRIRSETLSVIAAFEDAAATAGSDLSGRHVTLACPPRLTATTDAATFCDLLSLLLRESAREPGEVHAVAELDCGELVISFAGLHTGASSGRSLDRIQSLAARLGGHIDIVAHPDRVAGVRLRLPQPRADDAASAARSQSS